MKWVIAIVVTLNGTTVSMEMTPAYDTKIQCEHAGHRALPAIEREVLDKGGRFSWKCVPDAE